MEPTPDIVIFLGRFHALVVHLPIGFVCIAVLAELLFRKPGDANHRPLINFIWLLAALSATVSVMLGYLLSLQGGYNDNTLNWHKWAGILLALVIHVCYFVKKFSVQNSWTQYLAPVSLTLCTLLLIITGHYGGSLTHGSNYLSEYKPTSFAALLGESTERDNTAKMISSLDSADIFEDAIMPIIRLKCLSCHNTEKKKGNLVLSTFEEMMKGGEEGPAVVQGEPEKSGLYYRVTLPADDKKFMPTDGKKPLTDQQIAIIKWWIEQQAPKSATISTLQPDSAMVTIFNEYFGINENKNSLAAHVAPADPAALQELAKAGFRVTPLAANSNWLEVSWVGSEGKNIEVHQLTALKDQLAWLRITYAGKLDEALPMIGQLTHLQKLTLNDNDITDEKLSSLLSLTNLEYINLNNTQITNKGIEIMLRLKNLKRLYIAGSKIDSASVASLSAEYPNTKIVFYREDNELSLVDSIGKN